MAKQTWSVPRKVTSMHIYTVAAHNATEAAVLAGMALERGDEPTEQHDLGAVWLKAQKVIEDE